MKLLYFNQLQPYNNHSWKSEINNNTTIIPKNIKNSNVSTSKEYKKWSEDCPNKKYKFNANPIKHYRKQYTNVDSKNTFSNMSLVGSMDKPGNNIITQNNNCDSSLNNLNMLTYIHKNIDCNTLSNDKFFDSSLNKVVCNSLHPSALVIKRATTNLSNNYSSSHREYLNNKCKTYNQNLPINNDINNNNGTTTLDCNGKISCTTYNPSNKKFQQQGPVISSARTFSLKYGCKDGGSCKVDSNINNCPPNMSLEECNNLKSLLNSPNPVCYGCINDPTKIRRKRINILK